MWATPDADKSGDVYHQIVQDECVSTSQLIVQELAPSGTDSFIKYRYPVFKFPQSDTVYLHARVRICFPDKLPIGQTCDKDCPMRGKRSIASEYQDDLDDVISIGYMVETGVHHGAARLNMDTEVMTRQEVKQMVHLIFVVCIGSGSLTIVTYRL